MKALHPEYEIVTVTCKCTRVFNNVAYIKHLLTCDGTTPLQCPNCKKEFTNKSSKSRHTKEKCEFVDLEVYKRNKTILASRLIIENDGEDKIQGKIAMENVDEDVLSSATFSNFVDTDLELVMAYIIESPEEIQAACNKGYIHEYLTSITHFCGPMENRNVTRGHLKSATARVWDNGVFVKTQLDTVLKTIFKNNMSLVEMSLSHQILSKACVPSTKLSSHQQTRELRSIKLVIEQSGGFVAITRDTTIGYIGPATISGDEKRYKRMSIPQHIRNMVAAKQKWRCNCCDCLLSCVWHTDHEVALCEGGDNDIHNFQALCVECHTSKTALEAQLRSRNPNTNVHRVMVPPPGTYYK